MRAAHVDERVELREVVRTGDSVVLGARDARHRRGEHAVLVRMRAKPREVRLSVHVIEAHVSRPHAVEELAPAAPVVPVDDHLREAPERARDAAPERRGGRRQPETAVGRLGEHADARQRAEHAVDASGCAPTRLASAAGVSGPFASSSAMPSFAATNTSCEIQYPEISPSITSCAGGRGSAAFMRSSLLVAQDGGFHPPYEIYQSAAATVRHANSGCRSRDVSAKPHEEHGPLDAGQVQRSPGHDHALVLGQRALDLPHEVLIAPVDDVGDEGRARSVPCSRMPRRNTRSAVGTSSAPQTSAAHWIVAIVSGAKALASTSARRTTGQEGRFGRRIIRVDEIRAEVLLLREPERFRDVPVFQRSREPSLAIGNPFREHDRRLALERAHERAIARRIADVHHADQADLAIATLVVAIVERNAGEPEVDESVRHDLDRGDDRDRAVGGGTSGPSVHSPASERERVFPREGGSLRSVGHGTTTCARRSCARTIANASATAASWIAQPVTLSSDGAIQSGSGAAPSASPSVTSRERQEHRDGQARRHQHHGHARYDRGQRELARARCAGPASQCWPAAARSASSNSEKSASAAESARTPFANVRSQPGFTLSH